MYLADLAVGPKRGNRTSGKAKVILVLTDYDRNVSINQLKILGDRVYI